LLHVIPDALTQKNKKASSQSHAVSARCGDAIVLVQAAAIGDLH